MLNGRLSHHGLIKLFFLLQPLAFGSWLPRIPEVQHALGLDARSLAFALTGMPVGILLTLPFAGKLVDRTGPRKTLLVLLPIFLVCVTLPVWAASQAALFGGLLALGSAMSILELAMNVEADRLEKLDRISIMNSCHGFWSLGMMLGSLLGAGLSQWGLEPRWSVMATAMGVLVPAWVVAGQLPEAAAQPATEQGARGKAFVRPSPALLGIAFFVFGVTMTEGAIADWSAVFLHDVHDASGAYAGAGYGAFAAMMTLMRLRGDALKARYSALSVARISCLIALAGIAVVASSQYLAAAMLGFALVGVGSAVGFPLAVTAGGQLTDRPVASSVAIISFVALVGFLIGPVVIGSIAYYAGMRLGLVALAPALALSLLLSQFLQTDRKDAA